MYRLIYPVKNRALFTNRVVELETLELYKNRLLQGEANKIAFIGTRRIGKSTVLYEFIKRHAASRKLNMIYVNLQRMVMEPLSFAKSYIGLATKWVVKDREDNFASYDDPDYCMLQLQKLHPQAAEYLFQFIKLTQVRNVSLKSVLEQAFQFPKILSECLNRPFIVMIDEFQDIMLLNNFKQLPDILGFLRDRFQIHQSILYVFAGSYIRLMQSIIEDPNSAFFGQINPYYLSNFDKKDSMYFLNRINKQLQFDLPDEVKKKIVKISAGHPFYMELLANAANEAALIDGEPLTPESMDKILLLQLVNDRSTLGFHLRYLYEDALGRARGSTILHGILKVLAKDPSLTITEIADRMSRKPGLIQSNLSELMKVDLVKRRDKLYFISDPLLRWWVYFKFYHPEGAFSLQDRVVDELSIHFREKYLQATTELGKTKEFELYYFVMQMQGKKVGGIRIPAFKKLIKNYVLPDGKEIDLFARNKESWVFELKWKNKLVGMNEFRKLKTKIQVQRYVLISKKGFTKELLIFAEKSSEVILWGPEIFLEKL